MPVTVATVLSRIRSRLNEATAAFWPDSASTGLIGFYNDGAAQQHRIVIAQARQSGRLGDISESYLAHFAVYARINILTGQQLYDLPADFMEPIQFSASGAPNLANVGARVMTTEHMGQEVKPTDDWFIRHIPQMKPVFQRPLWSIAIDPADDGAAVDSKRVKLRVYAFGDGVIPNAPLMGRLYYYREVTRSTDAGNVDVDDPYNEGPIWYAVAEAAAKRGADPSPYMAMFQAAAQAVLAPPVASAATGQEAQAIGAKQQERGAESRDAR